jgi:hypothetical protein
MRSVRGVLLVAALALVTTGLGGQPPAAPTADVTIDRAVWIAQRSMLSASGTVSTGQPLGVFDGEGGTEFRRVRVQGESWRMRERGLSRSPCSLLVVSDGRIDQVPVENAPADCGPPVNLSPSCSITPPAPPLDVGTPLTFTAVAEDPEGLDLLFSWHFGGGVDQALSGEAESGVPFDTAITFELGGQAFPISLTVADVAGATGFCSTSVVVGTVPSASRPPVDEQPPPGDPRQQQHALLAFNDLGMHCADLGSVPLSILPPFNVFNAQLIERGDPPRLMSSVDAEMRYSAASNPADPVVGDPANEPPSINSTSSNLPVGAQAGDAQIRKTDFWDLIDPSDPAGPTVVETLFGIDLPLDEGLPTIHNDDGFGRRMPGILDPYQANDPQPFSTYQNEFGWFKAEGTPITNVDDYGRQNSYPLMRVEATAKSDGSVLAAIDAVVPVSTEVDCRDCHVKGLVGADPDARAVDLGFIESLTPGDRVDDEFAAKTNILILHDFKHLIGDDGSMEYDPPLADRGAVLCAVCHNSFALEEVTGGGLPGLPELPSMSEAAHGFHGSLKTDVGSGALLRDAEGEPIRGLDLEPGEGRLFPVDPLDLTLRMEENCFKCHPGQITQCFRGAMFTAGLKCSACHGDMLAVGGVFDGDFDDSGGSRARLPWRDEPRCESCHRGDAASPGESDMLTRLAFNLGDPAAVPFLAQNTRFAENRSPDPGTGGQELVLYRNSLDAHGGPGHDSAIACEACHGSPHAIWGNALPASNDNVPSNQLQGHSGTLSDCTVCHLPNSFPNGTLDGPHGMHPVNDPNWIKSDGGWHGEFAEDWSNGDPCASCHGVHHLGTRLSKTPVDRQLRDADGDLLATVSAGQEIGCNLCHDLEKSFDN